MSGALVNCEDGGRISQISLPSDFSAVMISGMPTTFSATRIHQLLRDLGHEIPMASIRVLRGSDSNSVKAHVTAARPEFATTLCQQLNTTSDPALTPLNAIPTAPRIPSLASSRRISCKKVLISWNKPVRLVWLNFGSFNIAERVCGKFNDARYTILGHAVSAEKPTGSQSPRNPMGWTVLLKSVPSNATRVDIDNAIHLAHDKPRHIEMGKVSNHFDVDTATALVESLFTRIGPVEFSMRPDTLGKRFKAVALFADEADAREAINVLHDQPQEFLNKDKLALQLLSSAKFKVSADIYECVRSQVASLVPSWRDQHLTFREYLGVGVQKRFITLKIEGEVTKLVAAATNTLETIVSGKVLQDDDLPFWEPSLTTNGLAFHKLKQIEKQYEVVVIRDKTKRQLMYFGPIDKFKSVQNLVVTDVKMPVSSTETIGLTADEFAWACRGGFNNIVSSLGKDVVAFDVVSNPKRIIVSGSYMEYQTVQNMVQRRSEGAAAKLKHDGDLDCTICWTSAEDPVTLDCDHVYCLECFQSLCTSAGGSGGDFLISCQGEMGNCKKVVKLEEVKMHIPSTVFEEVLEASFASYIRRRPDEYRFCPTPDCGFIYRSTNDKAYTCARCLEVTCTACNDQHGTMSCADFKDLKSGGVEAFERYKTSMHIKDCPKCKTSIEKTYGCNHMTCGGCAAHICWLCLEVFSASRPCYAHLRDQHGGIFDENDLLIR